MPIRSVFRMATASLVATTALGAGPSAQTARTLVAALAHADDEVAIAPLLAGQARDGVQVYLIVVSDGSAGSGQQGNLPRPDLAITPDQLARTRQEEAQCSANALGARPPIFLGFPDGKLGDYLGDRSLIGRVTQRLAEELQRLRPDVVITWGPDGGTGHPDHRIVSAIITQPQRTGAPGVPERLFYMNLPAELIRAVNPQGKEPPLLIPQARYFTTRVEYAPQDFATARRAIGCHRSQFTPEVEERAAAAAAAAWNGAVPLIPAFPAAGSTGLFK